MTLEGLCGAKKIPGKKTPQAAAASNLTGYPRGQDSVCRRSGTTVVDAILWSASTFRPVAAKGFSVDFDASPKPRVYIVAREKRQHATAR